MDSVDRDKQGEWSDATQDVSHIGHVGLLNLGNTCFMNSGLQVLLSSKHLIGAIMKIREQEKNDSNNIRVNNREMQDAFQNLIDASRGNRADIYRPDKIKDAASRLNKAFRGYGQQDSFELIQTVLDGLERETNRAKEVPYKLLDTDGMGYSKAQELFREHHHMKYDSPITKVTCTELAKCVMCTKCRARSYSFSYCQALLLDLPTKESRTEVKKTKKDEKQDRGSNGLSLSALINNSEKVYTVDNYYCAKCKTHQRVHVREWISEPAKCLIIQLKRFRNDGHSMLPRFLWKYSKNDSSVEYEDTLEIQSFECGQDGVERDDMQSDKTCPGSEVDSNADSTVWETQPQDDSSSENVVQGMTMAALETKAIARGIGNTNPPQVRSYKYQYRGASLHSGGLGGGHYTALCYGCNDKYYYCNDSNVILVDRGKLDTHAYVLLFDRVDC